MSIWSLVIEGDAVSVELFANSEDLYAQLREAWSVPDEVSDEDAPEWISDKAYGEIYVHIEEHVPPAARRKTPHETWVESVKKDGKCRDGMCACQSLGV